MSFATARRIPPALGQESVWDYPRPPRVENTSEHIEAIISGVKLVANYYTIEVNGKQAENVAWYYSKPTGPEFSSIKDHVAIYVGPMDECYVDGERVVPQPGQFYGGWITKDMVEPFKVATDNRAFELITGKGFVNFTQTVLSVGQDIVKSRSINASDLLPHPTTVSVSFCGISLHYLNDELQLQAFILGCYPYDRDNQTSTQIRQFVDSSRLQDVWVLQDIHYITTFLHPSFKNFDVNSILQERALNLVKSEIFKRQPSTSSTPCPSVDKTTIITPELNSQHKSLTNVLSKCFDLPKSDLRLSTTPDHEVDEYMSMNVQMKEGDDILLFWLAHKSRFPILFSIVQDYYAVPAANTTIERLFSASKNTVTDKRTSLGTEKINKLLFLQKNLLSLETFDKKILNEVDTKRKMSVHDETCLTTSLHKQEQLRTSTSAKKLKKDEQDDIFICDEDYEDYEDNENDKF
ncbi:unnamed protein product [Rotaria socialis]|uniref:HAT C-terminal dimerisation domain-containing protein n=1 Tax=Rotaria socialis TaxID=392032 RepID=A0A817PTR4_9BILA|nr:unnamed protein product [Rotaria socialis]